MSMVQMYLTAREMQILKLIVEDELSSAEIAKQLNISTSTVDTHRKHLLAKFNTNNSVGLTKCAIRQRIIKI